MSTSWREKTHLKVSSSGLSNFLSFTSRPRMNSGVAISPRWTQVRNLSKYFFTSLKKYWRSRMLTGKKSHWWVSKEKLPHSARNMCPAERGKNWVGTLQNLLLVYDVQNMHKHAKKIKNIPRDFVENIFSFVVNEYLSQNAFLASSVKSPSINTCPKRRTTNFYTRKYGCHWLPEAQQNWHFW